MANKVAHENIIPAFTDAGTVVVPAAVVVCFIWLSHLDELNKKAVLHNPNLRQPHTSEIYERIIIELPMLSIPLTCLFAVPVCNRRTANIRIISLCASILPANFTNLPLKIPVSWDNVVCWLLLFTGKQMLLRLDMANNLYVFLGWRK